MTRAAQYNAIRVRSCAACESTIITALELARRKKAEVPRGMKLYAGEFRGRPFCADCLPVCAKGVRK